MLALVFKPVHLGETQQKLDRKMNISILHHTYKRLLATIGSISLTSYQELPNELGLTFSKPKQAQYSKHYLIFHPSRPLLSIF